LGVIKSLSLNSFAPDAIPPKVRIKTTLFVCFRL
jgi:hypothetical protein